MCYELIQKRTIKTLEEVSGVGGRVIPESSLKDELLLEALDLIELLFRLEAEFSKAIPIEDLPASACVQDLIDLIFRLDEQQKTRILKAA